MFFFVFLLNCWATHKYGWWQVLLQLLNVIQFIVWCGISCFYPTKFFHKIKFKQTNTFESDYCYSFCLWLNLLFFDCRDSSCMKETIGKWKPGNLKKIHFSLYSFLLSGFVLNGWLLTIGNFDSSLYVFYKQDEIIKGNQIILFYCHYLCEQWNDRVKSRLTELFAQ